MYEPLISSTEERALYDAFGAAWDRYAAVGYEAVRLAEAGKAADGAQLMSAPTNITSTTTNVRTALAKDVALNERGATWMPIEPWPPRPPRH